MPLWKSYTGQIAKGLSYCATWPPSNKITLGEVALMMKDRTLERQMSIGDFGLDIEDRTGHEVNDRGWTSGTDVAFNPGAGAGAPLHPGLDVDGRIKVSFTRKNAILLRLERVHEQSLERIDRLRKEMLRLDSAGEWDPSWVVITQVVHARRMIVLVSERKSASADLKASMQVGADPIAVVNAQGELELLRSSGMSLQETGENLTPMYKALRVKPRWMRHSKIKQINKRGRARSGGESDVVELTF
jgi:hypothetical protein